ncbi:hypothetical protein Hanom_Chr00s004981g01727301 [Helianthus anomalus]
MICASGDEFSDVYELNHIRFVPFLLYLGMMLYSSNLIVMLFFQRPRSATCLGNRRIRFNAVMNAQRSGSSNKRASK